VRPLRGLANFGIGRRPGHSFARSRSLRKRAEARRDRLFYARAEMEPDRLTPPRAPVACPGCDLVQCIPPLTGRQRAYCPRCRQALATAAVPPDRPIALTLAAIAAFATANATPLMTLSAEGRAVSTTLAGGATMLWSQGSGITAAAVAFCAVVAPAAYLALLLAALLAVKSPPAPRWAAVALRGALLLRTWAMPEVLLLGILVALVKIAQLAVVTPGIALYSLGVFIVLVARVQIDLDPRDCWQRVRWAADPSRPASAARGSP